MARNRLQVAAIAASGIKGLAVNEACRGRTGGKLNLQAPRWPVRGRPARPRRSTCDGPEPRECCAFVKMRTWFAADLRTFAKGLIQELTHDEEEKA
jgi:hypothetical protein